MKKIFLICSVFLPFLIEAQELKAFRNQVENGYNFWMYTPEIEKEEDSLKPLIIFLHGQSLSGNNLYRAKKYGTINAIEIGRKIDAYVLNPQKSNEGWKPEKIYNIMNWALENYAIDTNRIYVLGMSAGGYGTINFAGTYPDKIAAAMALCGGGYLSEYCGLNELPLWIIHGTADRAVTVAQSEKVVKAMKNCGDTPNLIFDKWAGVNHSSLARLFYLPETYEWLFSHTLNDRNVNREVVINKSSLNVAYQNVDRSSVQLEVVDNSRALDNSVQATAGVAAGANAKVHVIKKGETLGAIAQRYRTTVSKLCQINNLRPTSILQIGQKIRIY